MLRQSKGFSLPEGYKIIYKLPKKANYFFTVGKKFFTSAGCSKKACLDAKIHQLMVRVW